MNVKRLSQAELEHYYKRTLRNHFWVNGKSGQSKIHDFRVGVAGLGGMGSNIAEIFCRLGVGAMRATDPDTIERTNINRQVIAFEDTVGHKKAEASINELRKISSDINLEFSTVGIQENNVEAFVSGLDVIINEIDVFHIDKQILLLEAARRRGIPVYTTLVVGLGVHLYKYDPAGSYTPKDFLEIITVNKDVQTLIDRLGQPLPVYLQGNTLKDFVKEVGDGNVPIFGASTYLGQSLLAIRVLFDFGFLRIENNIPKTPSLPQFLVLDPLTLQFEVAEVDRT
ncbi:MAG: ThiF family adenylyltransferase [Bdellovibrionaceae bacterium]|nr:ThiF family adenylyltransferase [Pseudobdellovibrionaceae bacterium]